MPPLSSISVFRMIDTKTAVTVTEEAEDKNNRNLVHRLSKNHPDHTRGEKLRSSGIRFLVQWNDRLNWKGHD